MYLFLDNENTYESYSSEIKSKNNRDLNVLNVWSILRTLDLHGNLKSLYDCLSTISANCEFLCTIGCTGTIFWLIFLHHISGVPVCLGVFFFFKSETKNLYKIKFSKN